MRVENSDEPPPELHTLALLPILEPHPVAMDETEQLTGAVERSVRLWVNMHTQFAASFRDSAPEGETFPPSLQEETRAAIKHMHDFVLERLRPVSDLNQRTSNHLRALQHAAREQADDALVWQHSLWTTCRRLEVSTGQIRDRVDSIGGDSYKLKDQVVQIVERMVKTDQNLKAMSPERWSSQVEDKVMGQIAPAGRMEITPHPESSSSQQAMVALTISQVIKPI